MNTDLFAYLLAGGAIFSVLIAVLVWYLLLVIANWKIFQKFGEPGWKSIIPVYNSYILYKYTWNTRMFFITLVVSLVAGVCSSTQSSTILALIGLVFAIAVLVLNVMHYNKLAMAFGHGIGFTIGLLILSNIFMLILGFGKDEYILNDQNYL